MEETLFSALSLPQIDGLYEIPLALQTLLDEIPVGIVILDPRRRIVLINRALEILTGFLPRDAIGLECCFILRSNLCLDTCPIKRLSQETGPVCVEGNIINRNRQKVPIRVTSASLGDLSGKTAGFVETIEDLRFLDEKAGEGKRSYSFIDLIGASPEIQRIFQILPVIAMTNSSVLITGQTGTGKDLVAEAIHHASDRVKGPFVKVNCGAVPETLLESELFGHEKGAFTGAVMNKPGRFRLAHNGTLYLTEIGDLPLALQVKLLSFLDDKVVHPLGGSRGFPVDVRVIAATHRNLEHMVQQGSFREDLLFRLNVVRIHLPPLSHRGEDVGILINHFFRLLTSRFNKRIEGFSEKAHQILLDYSYPGNVRELRNIVEYAVNICEEKLIQPRHLPKYIMEAEKRTDSISRDQETAPAKASWREELPTDFDWPAAQRKLILDAMRASGGRKGKAAALLGWGRSTLWRKMKRFGIEP